VIEHFPLKKVIQTNLGGVLLFRSDKWLLAYAPTVDNHAAEAIKLQSTHDEDQSGYLARPSTRFDPHYVLIFF